jgi:hypothetical protein
MKVRDKYEPKSPDEFRTFDRAMTRTLANCQLLIANCFFFLPLKLVLLRPIAHPNRSE